MFQVFEVVSHRSPEGVNWSGGQKIREGKQLNRGSDITLNISKIATPDFAGVVVTDKKG